MEHTSASRRRVFLVLSQTFVPDPAAVGQHMASAAIEMARRGWRVLVYTANRGYDDPSVRYAPREVIGGVEIRRLPLSSFGKKSIFTRVLGTASFLVQSLWLALFTRNVCGILVSTSPPLIGLATLPARILRGVPVIYWAMDLNPDQLIAMGHIKPRGPIAAMLEAANRFILHSASLIITLDRFMAGRLLKRAPIKRKLAIVPPWPQGQPDSSCDAGENPFRARHNLTGKFVIMYSGNHSPANPLDTLLEAMPHFRDDPEIRFVFVGGGVAKKGVERFIRENNLSNALCLPYQPLSELRYSLAAADVHVVSLGNAMVGICHPCKIYGAMSVGRPVLFLGPAPSHVADLLALGNFGVHVRHGDVEGMVRAIRALREMSPDARQHMGRVAAGIVNRGLTEQVLCGRLCDAIERTLAAAGCVCGGPAA